MYDILKLHIKHKNCNLTKIINLFRASSNVCKEYIVGPFVPMVFLPIIVSPWAWIFTFGLFYPWLPWFKRSGVLKQLSLLFLSVFVLNLFYNVIIIKLFLFDRSLLESLLPHSESWLFNYQIWVILLLFDDPRRNIVVVDVVNTWGRHWAWVEYSLSLCTWLKNW